jgi:hypothetical protein
MRRYPGVFVGVDLGEGKEELELEVDFDFLPNVGDEVSVELPEEMRERGEDGCIQVEAICVVKSRFFCIDLPEGGKHWRATTPSLYLEREEPNG